MLLVPRSMSGSLKASFCFQGCLCYSAVTGQERLESLFSCLPRRHTLQRAPAAPHRWGAEAVLTRALFFRAPHWPELGFLLGRTLPLIIPLALQMTDHRDSKARAKLAPST